MAGNLTLPLVDLSNPDRAAAAKTVRQACIEHGFFYLINHGIEDSFIQLVFEQSKNFFSLSLEEKTKLPYNEDYCGYTAMYSETLDVSSEFKGDLKESFYIGPIPAASSGSKEDPNQWPQEEVMPSWRATMESYYEKILTVARNLAGLVALALDLDEIFFEEIGALHDPMGFIRLLHYPGESLLNIQIHIVSLIMVVTSLFEPGQAEQRRRRVDASSTSGGRPGDLLRLKDGFMGEEEEGQHKTTPKKRVAQQNIFHGIEQFVQLLHMKGYFWSED